MKIRLSFLALIPALTVCAGELPPEAGNGLIEINGKRMNLALDPQGDITCRSLLSEILGRAAGKKLPIYRKIDPKLDNYVIRFLSPRESAEMNRTDKDAVYFLLCEDGKTLSIGGNIRYGLYDFLKRFTPYRQFGGMPSEVVVPELKSIKLPLGGHPAGGLRENASGILSADRREAEGSASPFARRLAALSRQSGTAQAHHGVRGPLFQKESADDLAASRRE